MPSAVFKQMDGASKIVIQEFLGAGLPINTGKHTRISRAIQHPISSGKGSQINLVSDVSDTDVDPKGAKRFEICLTPFAN